MIIENWQSNYRWIYFYINSRNSQVGPIMEPWVCRLRKNSCIMGPRYPESSWLKWARMRDTARRSSVGWCWGLRMKSYISISGPNPMHSRRWIRKTVMLSIRVWEMEEIGWTSRPSCLKRSLNTLAPNFQGNAIIIACWKKESEPIIFLEGGKLKESLTIWH